MRDASPVLRTVRATTRLSATHPRLVLLATALVIVASWGYARGLRLETDFLNLLPSKSAAALRFREAVDRRRGSASTLFVLVESGDASLNRRFIDAIEPEVRALPRDLVGSVEHGPGEARAYFERNRWLFASEPTLERVACELEQARASASPGYLDLGNPCEDIGEPLPADTAPAAAGADGEKHTALRDFQARADAAYRKHDQFPGGYFSSEEGRTWLLLVRSPSQGFGDRAGERLMTEVERITARAGRRLGVPPAAVGFAGDIPSALADVQSLRDDISVVSAAAILLIFGTIVVFFRSPLALLHIGLAVFAGSGIAFAMAMAAFGHLNNATGFLGSIIFGNGINYGIVYLARYRERRGHGDAVGTALEDAAVTCFTSTWLASLATSGAYVALMITSFRGFSEFGLIGGVGMLCCWLATFLVVPASITALERLRGAAPDRQPRQLRTPFAQAVAAVASTRPGLVLALTAVLSVFSALPLARYLADPWEYDFSKLRSKSSEERGAGALSKRADEVFKTRGSPQLMLADDIGQVLDLAAQVRAADARRTGGAFVERVETVYDVLGGAPDEVRRKLELLGQIRVHIDHLLPRLDEEETAIARTWRPPEHLRPLTPEDLPALVRERFTEKDGRLGTSLFVYLSPAVSQSRGQNLLKISDVLADARLPDGREVPNAARATVFAEMIRSMHQDAPRATLAALLIVSVVCLLVERSLVPVATILGSLLCGVLWTVGGAAWFDVRLNFLNFVALPLTFGIGVEYAVNLYDRIRAGGGDVAAGVQSVGGAVMACSLTTIFGYGALLFADNQALRSFGRYAIAGEFACITTALFVMPAALVMAQRRRG